MPKPDCGPGMILKDGYDRKAYMRKAYVDRYGNSIKKKKIEATHVNPACVTDTGAKGKGDKILPQPKKHILGKFGYSTKNSRADRRESLDKASNVYGILPVLRHVTLIHNLSANANAKEKFAEDKEYLKNKYAPYKQQRGGFDEDYINIIKIEDYVPTPTQKVNEEHMIGGSVIKYSSVEVDNGPDQISIYKDGDSKGSFSVEIYDNIALITNFQTTKGFNTALHTFMENYARGNDASEIDVELDVNDDNYSSKMDFWHNKDYTVYNTEHGTVIMNKKLN